MSSEPRNVSEVSAKESLGSLSGCLVDGDGEQHARQRRVKRRALAISIFVQSAVLAALILVPLFGRTQRIALAYATPIPPYSPYRNTPRSPGAPQPHPTGPQTGCRFCPPTNIPPHIVTRDTTSSANQADDALPGMGEGIPGAGEGLINLSDPRRTVLPPPHTERQITRPPILHVTTIDPAMLIHRVEPKYPALAIQTHREGRVELRAVIGTDGRIESLQVVSGDPLFLMSARQAVEQWRYRPTYLNGQAVEIDTFITVVYTMQH